MERIIKDLVVKCSNCASGCSWSGELRNLEVLYVILPLKYILLLWESCDSFKFKGNNHYWILQMLLGENKEEFT